MTLPPGYRLSEDKADLQLDVIHAFLSNAYWSARVPRAVVERAIANSMCVGVYGPGGAQVAFARLITDRATFAYLADVFVIEAARGQGLAKAMVAHFLDHPELQGLRRWMLVTRDAHGVYAKFGFEGLDEAQRARIMQRLDPDVYRRAAS